MNMKTSQSLSPDENSMLQAIKSIHYEVYYCSTVDEAIVSDILSAIGMKKVVYYGSLVCF